MIIDDYWWLLMIIHDYWWLLMIIDDDDVDVDAVDAVLVVVYARSLRF